MVTLGVLMVGGGIAIMNISGALRGAHVETAYQNTLNQMRFARQVAIDKRTVCRVDFVAPGTITVTQAFADGNPVQTETLTLPADVKYTIVAGMPTPPAATPDNIGNGTIAIDFDRVKAGGGTTIFFQPDGSALDAVGLPNDGVIYIARPNELNGARAITLLGTTGRIRGWRLGAKSGGGVVWE
jgi:Tfp pilus assembly protein FimT